MGDHSCSCPSVGVLAEVMQLEMGRQGGRKAFAEGVLQETSGCWGRAHAPAYAQGFRGRSARLRAGVKHLPLV